MRHAYLILAHNAWSQLEHLVRLLDHPDNDLFIHIDRKAAGCPDDRLRAAARHSRVEILREFRIDWGSYAMVEAELALFARAAAVGYDYYHLLSGADLPLKSQSEIHAFFEAHAGQEFVCITPLERARKNPEIARRTRVYHWFQNYRHRFRSAALNGFFTFLDRGTMALQLALGVNRLKKHPGLEIAYGSQWVSITDALVRHILDRRELIRDVFRCTNCADELFIQTLVHNSDFRHRLHRPVYDGSCESNRRFIDWQRGHGGSPYTFTLADAELLLGSDCLFARKFSREKDAAICDLIESRISEAASGQ